MFNERIFFLFLKKVGLYKASIIGKEKLRGVYLSQEKFTLSEKIRVIK